LWCEGDVVSGLKYEGGEAAVEQNLLSSVEFVYLPWSTPERAKTPDTLDVLLNGVYVSASVSVSSNCTLIVYDLF